MISPGLLFVPKLMIISVLIVSYYLMFNIQDKEHRATVVSSLTNEIKIIQSEEKYRIPEMDKRWKFLPKENWT